MTGLEMRLLARCDALEARLLALEKMEADLLFDADRGFVLRLARAGHSKDFILPIPFDAGVWAAGNTYVMGAGVTWDGHYWIALKETSTPPGESTEWRLAVRRGKQGREGPRGKQGPAAGKDDDTQIDAEGSTTAHPGAMRRGSTTGLKC